jgi:hypothetical protein
MSYFSLGKTRLVAFGVRRVLTREGSYVRADPDIFSVSIYLLPHDASPH